MAAVSRWVEHGGFEIAGHRTLRMTEEYTKIQLTRQEELTRLIQESCHRREKRSAVIQ
jgi:hypothetical protein